ncbi:MAG TPA: hypothetical protein VHL80_02470 [Polyangia bacterium]|nr:hypothetical protein [Polyangia bacterium]
MSPRRIVVASSWALLSCASAHAGERAGEAPEASASAAPASRTPAEVDAFLGEYAPAPVDGPELRLPYSPTRLWFDGGFASTDDLSALPYITGSGRNFRLAAGGAWRWGDLAFTGELPFDVTTVDFLTLNNQPPRAGDTPQTSVALGDLRLGADWTRHLGDGVLGGFGLRARLPTHTTHYVFHLADGSTASYYYPYYTHLEPTAILGGALGRFTFVLNQGAVVLTGPDGSFNGFYIHVPNIFFWDAAYAVSYAPVDVLAASVELATDVQLNHIGGFDFTKLNDVRSVWIAPALQLHVGGYRVDAVARFGLSQSANLFGIIEYAGKSSYTLRVSRTF